MMLFRNCHQSRRLHLLQWRMHSGSQQHLQGVGSWSPQQVWIRELHQGDEAGPGDRHLEHGVHGNNTHQSYDLSLSHDQVTPNPNQNYTLYGAVPSAINLRRIKVKNGRLVNCNLNSVNVADWCCQHLNTISSSLLLLVSWISHNIMPGSFNNTQPVVGTASLEPPPI